MKGSFVHDEPTVFILETDHAACDAAKAVVRQLRLHAECYHSAGDFLDACDPQRRGCVLLDIHMPGLEGIDGVERLPSRGIVLPVLLLAARPELPAVVRAIKAGAFHYLKKPCDNGQLAEAIQEAILCDRENHRCRAYCAKMRRRLARLTPGEHQVLQLMIDGRSNKGIAAELTISVRAVEDRRAKVMKKMGATSLASLIRTMVLLCSPLGDLRLQEEDVPPHRSRVPLARPR